MSTHNTDTNSSGALSNPVGWFEIYVADMGRAKAFYERMLGAALADMPDPTGQGAVQMSAFAFDAQGYGASGALVRMDGMAPGGGGVLVYFSCADCAVQAAQAVAAGGQLVQAKTAIGQHGHFALICDSEGNTVGLHSNV